MATSASMAIRINESLGFRNKKLLTRAMFWSVVAGKKVDVFSRRKSPRFLLGGGVVGHPNKGTDEAAPT
jgi:hypothetical protein